MTICHNWHISVREKWRYVGSFYASKESDGSSFVKRSFMGIQWVLYYWRYFSGYLPIHVVGEEGPDPGSEKTSVEGPHGGPVCYLSGIWT